MENKDLKCSIVLYGEARTQSRNLKLRQLAFRCADAVYQTTWQFENVDVWRSFKNNNFKHVVKFIEPLTQKTNYEKYSYIIAKACENSLVADCENSDISSSQKIFVVTRPDIEIYEIEKFESCLKTVSDLFNSAEQTTIFCGVFLHSHLSDLLCGNLRGQDIIFFTNAAGLRKLSKFNLSSYSGLDFENGFILFCKHNNINIEYLNFFGGRDFNILRKSRRSGLIRDLYWIFTENFKSARNTLRLFQSKSR